MSIAEFPSRPASRRAIPRQVSAQVCGQVLGELIRKARVGDGRPLEEIAPRAALTVPEWEAIEAGQVPDTLEQVCLIAAALDRDRSWMASLAPLCQGAWQK